MQMFEYPYICSALATHRRRNYLFSLGTDLSLDSTHAGNDTRYINHAETEKANCLPMGKCSLPT